MKLKKLILCVVIASLFTSFAFAKKITVQTTNGPYEIDLGDDIPDIIIDLIEENSDLIDQAIKDNGLTVEDFEKAEEEGVFDEIKDTFKEVEGDSIDNPVKKFDDAIGGFKDYTKTFAATVANAQLTQNVWADAWIGNFYPFSPDGVHIGGGMDIGMAQLKLKPLKNIMQNLTNENMRNIPDNLFLPAIAADFRIGGIVFPFDIGFSVFSLDLSKFGIDLDGFEFKWFSFGIDARYALLTGEGWLPKVSVGAGIAYTNIGLGFNDTEFGAGVGLKTFDFYLQTQVSKKFAVIIPFAGLKLGFSNTKLGWNVAIDWDSILGTDKKDLTTEQIGNVSLTQLNILPPSIGQEISRFRFIPQLYGGFGLDLFVFNFTFFGGIDIVNSLWSAGFNFRIAW